MPEENSTRGIHGRRLPLRFVAAIVGFVGLVHVSAPDCWERGETHPRSIGIEVSRSANLPMDFQATAYCEKGITKSGLQSAPGIVAADVRLLPLGSLIQLDSPWYSGIYHVMDTGRLVKGKIIDIFIRDRQLAIEFGRRNVTVTVLRYGFSAERPDGQAREKETNPHAIPHFIIE